ncbi:MAG TPA: arginine--tRNA ligase [Candidatus Binatia bacterium]|nr:arginine--tRNA ligase [Candidatus Binatia bacterium]
MKQELTQAIELATKDLFGVAVKVELTRPDSRFGDYATNVALALANKLGQNPQQVAETLAARLKVNLAAKLADIQVAPPGFLNLRLKDEVLAQMLELKPTKSLTGQTVLAEYSDPNPFKPLHAGHLYTTLVGDTIARLVEQAGAKTIRINYSGDVGLHVAKSLWAIIKHLGGELPDKLSEVPVKERPEWLGERYVEGHAAYTDDPTAKAEIVNINKQVYQLQAKNDHTSALAQLYFTCRDWSYDYFKDFYKQLEVTPFDRYIPESEVTPVGVLAVEAGLAKGIYEKSQGAVVFNGERFGLHTRVFITAEGLPTYETKDVGLSLTKWQDYHFDRSIIITANEQAQYMAVVIASLKQFAPQPAERTKHLTHGVIKLKSGVRMKSREGNVVTAMQVLESARAAGKASGLNINESTVLAAVKYAFAKSRIGADIIYDPEESIALEGNSGPYLQYAHARARSILAKIAGSDGGKDQAELTKLEPAERALLLKITQYPEVVDYALSELMPHHICTYLYELAQSFNAFYEGNRVIGDARQAIRLKLVEAYAQVLQGGLELLGIEAPERL